jgi:hypothetical protein
MLALALMGDVGWIATLLGDGLGNMYPEQG